MMFRSLKCGEVEARVGQCSDKGCTLLLYKTSRTDMALLDETVGPENWQCDYKTIDGKLFCGIGVNVGGNWVWKWDTGTESNMEPQKGEASDAFKRAGFKWGIGRELYETPFIFIPADRCSVTKNKNGKPACWDRFEVSKLGVSDGRVLELEIRNMSKNGLVAYSCNVKKKPAQPVSSINAAKGRMWNALKRFAELEGRNPNEVLEGVKSRSDWSETEEFMNGVAAEFESEVKAKLG